MTSGSGCNDDDSIVQMMKRLRFMVVILVL